MVEGIFKKIKKTFVGSNEIEVYDGDKGNFGYIYFIDSKTRDVMSLLVNPTASKARVVGGKVAAAGIETEARYASSKSYRRSFAFVNIDATPKVKLDEITSKMRLL